MISQSHSNLFLSQYILQSLSIPLFFLLFVCSLVRCCFGTPTESLISSSLRSQSLATHSSNSTQVVLISLTHATLSCTDSTNSLSHIDCGHAHTSKITIFTSSNWFQQVWLHPSITDGDVPFRFYLKSCYANSISIAYSMTLRRYGFSRSNEKWLLHGDSPLIKIGELLTVATPETTFLVQ